MRHKKMRLDLRAATFLDPCGNEKYYAEKFYAAPDRHSNRYGLISFCTKNFRENLNVPPGLKKYKLICGKAVLQGETSRKSSA